jgi:hypothetical protein
VTVAVTTSPRKTRSSQPAVLLTILSKDLAAAAAR